MKYGCRRAEIWDKKIAPAFPSGFWKLETAKRGCRRLQVRPIPTLGSVQRPHELRRGAGEGVAAAEGVVGPGNDEQLRLARRPLGEAAALGSGHAFIVRAMDDQPGRA